MKNSNKTIYIVGYRNVNLIDCSSTLKLKIIWSCYFKKNIPVMNKPTRVSCNNATIVDHINTNHFLNNDISSLLCRYLAYFYSRARKKILKIHPEKNSLYFWKWNFLPLILKNFRKRKPWSGNPKKFLSFTKMELSSLSINKILIFYLNKAFLIFLKREPCTFQLKREK